MRIDARRRIVVDLRAVGRQADERRRRGGSENEHERDRRRGYATG